MNARTYQQIVAIINEYSSWARVNDADASMSYMSTMGGMPYHSLVCCMTLVAHHAHGRYRQGHWLSIAMADLHDAIQELAAFDPVFASRATMAQLTRRDVETIVRTATHGLVCLRLTENYLPLPKFGVMA